MQVVDLTHNIEEGMLTFASHWHPLVEISQLGRIRVEGRETRKITFGTHTGTHMDAPLHFVENGKSIDQIDLNFLIGDVTILDFSYLSENQALTPEMIKESQFSERMIFYFGWSKYWNTAKFYQDYPFFAPETAELLVRKGVKLIGMDTASPDDSRIKLDRLTLGTSLDSPIHKIFLPAGMILVEYLANLNQVIDDLNGWKLVALPMKIKGADGAPIRACLYK